MPRALTYCVLGAVAALGAVLALPLPSRAEDAKAATATSVPETEEEKKEREIRRVCAVKVCSTLYNQKPADGHVTCNVQKTWRKEFLVKVMSRGKINWPWGNARCIGDLKLDRAILIKSMTEKEFEAQFDKHDLRCELEAENGEVRGQAGDPPQSHLQGRKGGEGQAELGQDRSAAAGQDGPVVGHGRGQSFGVLQSLVVDDINDFIQIEVHGGEGGVAGQVASPSPSRAASRARRQHFVPQRPRLQA